MRARQFAVPPLRTDETSKPRVDQALLAKVIAIYPELAHHPHLSQPQQVKVAAAVPVPLPETELEAAVACFVRGKVETVGEQLRALAAEQRRLEAQVLALKQEARAGLRSILRLMDADLVKRHGRVALAKHDRFLESIDTNVNTLLS